MDLIENVARHQAAIENLTNHQQQADMDGTFVKVSRQALDEVLSFIAAMQQAQQEVIAWRYERTDGFVILVSKRYTDQHPKGDGWTEQALGVIPTPPNGGSDAE